MLYNKHRLTRNLIKNFRREKMATKKEFKKISAQINLFIKEYSGNTRLYSANKFSIHIDTTSMYLDVNRNGTVELLKNKSVTKYNWTDTESLISHCDLLFA